MVPDAEPLLDPHLQGLDPSVRVLRVGDGSDIDLDLARRVRERSLDYKEAVARNLYRPVGEGGANVKRVTEALQAVRFRGWYTLEQETRLASRDDRPLGRISRSLEFLLPLLA